MPAVIVKADPSLLVHSAKNYASEARAHGTRKAYKKHWSAFSAWCANEGVCELPAAPQTVALYLAARADGGLKVATLALALAAIPRRIKSPDIHRPAAIDWSERRGKAFGAGLGLLRSKNIRSRLKTSGG